jgi:CheY-like chemotaxis protein
MCHVLIIEDDAIAAYDIRDTLKAQGATTFSFAATEREAVDCAREAPPALITSDVMLGAGSGPQAVRLILAELGPTPVIFITATPEACLDCGPYPVLEKPFSAGQLADLFRAVAPV